MTNDPETLLLDIRDVVAGYDGSEVLSGITMSIASTETAVVLGPNGHGKSTLLRTISGLMHPTRGSIRFAGTEITRRRAEDIAAMGLIQVPQGDLPFPLMTVNDNLLMGAYRPSAWANREARREHVFELFPQLAARRGAVARSLSGGERRMLALGRGLMADATMLLIDEPSLGLAPRVISEVYAAIMEIKRSGMPMLLVEESATHAESIADTVYVLETGAIAASGPASQMLRDERLLAAYLG